MATASAGRATRVRRELPRVPRALAARRPRGLGAGQGANKPTARQPSSCAQTRGADMTRHDPEIEELREKVHCAVVLERRHAGSLIARKVRSSASSTDEARARSSSSAMLDAVGGIQRAMLKAMSSALCKGSIQGLASDMSASVCERSLDYRHVFCRPIGQGAERSRIEPSPPAGPSERRFGLTLRPGAILDDSAGCRQRSLRRHL